jgi:hypothetical protein
MPYPLPRYRLLSSLLEFESNLWESKLCMFMQRSRQERHGTGSAEQKIVVGKQSRAVYPPRAEMQVRGEHLIHAGKRWLLTGAGLIFKVPPVPLVFCCELSCTKITCVVKFDTFVIEVWSFLGPSLPCRRVEGQWSNPYSRPFIASPGEEGNINKFTVQRRWSPMVKI